MIADTPDQDAQQFKKSAALATPWRRYIARHIDIVAFQTITYLILISITTFIRGSIPSESFEWYILLFISLPVAFLIDAHCINFLGATPGKALLGVKIQKIDGQAPSLVDHWERNFWGVYIQGLAMGIPIANLVALAKQYDNLRKSGQTTYDERLKIRAHRHSYPLTAKVVAAISLAAIFLVATATLIAIEPTHQNQISAGLSSLQAQAPPTEQTTGR